MARADGVGAVLAGLAVLLLYAATLAPTAVPGCERIQYALMHCAALAAHEAHGPGDAYDHHARRLAFWNRVVGD